MIPIVLAPINKELVITKVLANDKDKRHLESMGISVNEKVTVLSNSGGAVICRIKDGRIGLDQSLSTKIFV